MSVALVIGVRPEVVKMRALLGSVARWENPFGDGHPGERIARLLAEL